MSKKTEKDTIPFEKISDEDALITDKAFVVVGNVDAGKSTLIGTLISGVLDNGRGSAREKVARHQHEIDSGKTSDVSTRILNFPNGKTATLIDLCGHEKYFTTTATGISGMFPDYAIVVVSPTRGILPMTKQHFRMLMSYNIPVMFVVTRVDMALEESCKIVDKDIKELCKNYKRTIELMNGYDKYHSYMRGQNLATKLGLKEDDLNNFDTSRFDQETNVEQSLIDLNEYFKFPITKMTMIGEIDQGLKMAGGKQAYIPVIYVSNVNGYCLDVVKQVMYTVEPRDLWSHDGSIVKFFRDKLKIPDLGLTDNHVGSTFYIDSVFAVKGVGIVVSGIVRGDEIKVDDEMYLGPVGKDFIKVKLRSMHNSNRKDVRSLSYHGRGCIAIKPSTEKNFTKSQIGRGMVLISKLEMVKNACYRFESAITIYGGHSATLRTGYSPVVHAGTIRQVAKMFLQNETNSETESEIKIEDKDKTHKIKSGDIARVTFKFRFHSEYLDPGTVFVFRSGDLHGVGCVISVLQMSDDPDAKPEPLKKKHHKVRPVNPTLAKTVVKH